MNPDDLQNGRNGPKGSVLLLNQYYAPDGSATAQMLADLGSGLAEAGFAVRAVASNRSYADPAKRYPREERIEGVTVQRVRTTGFGRASMAGRMLDYLTYMAGAKRAVLFGARPDVIVVLTTPPFLAFMVTSLARLRGARTIFWCMDAYPDVAIALGQVREKSLTARVTTMMARRTMQHADRVVALGETMARRLEDASRGRTIDIIHNWADEAIRPLAREKNRLRAEWGWSDDFVVMYSGNMGLAHEFDTLLAICAEMRADPVRFVFLGGGPRMPEIAERVRRDGFPNVELRPYAPRADLPLSLTAGDVHLITLREAMAGLVVPSKLYGILSAGRPVLYIGPAAGEVYEIVREEKCGIPIAVGDVEGGVAAIRGYMNDRGRVERDGARARSVFESRFSRDRALREWQALVQDSVTRG